MEFLTQLLLVARALEEAFGWFECKMSYHLFLFDRNVWIIGEVLEAEVKENAYKRVSARAT
jgi:flavin reductase (DIM6/NTAB) family NADH-FMN oxidoreductase RutF